MLHQKSADSAGAGELATPSPEAGVTERRATERGRPKIGSSMAQNYLPLPLETEGNAPLERVQQKWEPVLRPDTRQIKDLEQDVDSKKSHLALSQADTPVAVESAIQDLMEPLLTETTVFAPPLCPDWLDTSPAISKRRVFPAEEKARIVTESFESGRSVCSVARRYRLRASQLFAWRKSARLQRERRNGDRELVPTEPAENKCGDAQPSLARQARPAEIATGRGAETTQKGAAATLKEVLRSLIDNI